ncbi:AGC/NDR protein kinase [Pleurostoma richardsiae]|uniref:non-specific serine/threonine protein kinase n=1 Tax=Pleurostoma richardsiae TaxID=41990 RepID=A0AA38VLD6_9PEZI|nr:AGC/NDR protein kinase [Pleurostoma richardsiae]
MSSSVFGLSVEPTVVHRSTPKSRPSLRSMESSPAQFTVSTESSSSLNGHSSTSNSHSGKPPKQPESTAKTSLSSKLSSSKGTSSGEKRGPTKRRNLANRSSPDGTLTTIEETVDESQVTPTVVTVERAAAAKIYLETYYHEALSYPPPRSLRRRLMEGELYHLGESLTVTQKENVRKTFYRQESDHLRQKTEHSCDDYNVVRILGKGSFGVVRLVRDKRTVDDSVPTKQVYAMKVIRKSAMLRTSQEGHLRAERDFLVNSEGSRWIVPLVASFQDACNLYLVMEYMPGGDFLGLLIRENILHETVARFYIAEMVVCVEEAHALKIIHRDIKPDNFLISASGHLKISDFGLAFNGHWSHDTAYYNSQRYSLIQKLKLNVEGDETDKKERPSACLKWISGINSGLERHDKKDPSDDEPLLQWRNRCGWSIGVILYECLYGHTPFLAEEGRHQTKQNILNHRVTFTIPSRPMISHRCQHLIASLLQEKEDRLCSRRYRFKDMQQRHSPSSTPSNSKAVVDFSGRYVYPYDAEDIKAHKWFKGVPWDRLIQLEPPFVPHIHSVDDSHYFDEEEPISDWSDSEEEEDENGQSTMPGTSVVVNATGAIVAGGEPLTLGQLTSPSLEKKLAREAELAESLREFPPAVQGTIKAWIATPYDSVRLRNMEGQINAEPSLQPTERELLKQVVRCYGKKERKRPRDRLLRDKNTRGTVMDLRKKNAFLGYTWRRTRAPEYYRAGRVGLGIENQFWYPGATDLAAIRALHKGKMSLG